MQPYEIYDASTDELQDELVALQVLLPSCAADEATRLAHMVQLIAQELEERRGAEDVFAALRDDFDFDVDHGPEVDPSVPHCAESTLRIRGEETSSSPGASASPAAPHRAPGAVLTFTESGAMRGNACARGPPTEAVAGAGVVPEVETKLESNGEPAGATAAAPAAAAAALEPPDGGGQVTGTGDEGRASEDAGSGDGGGGGFSGATEGPGAEGWAVSALAGLSAAEAAMLMFRANQRRVARARRAQGSQVGRNASTKRAKAGVAGAGGAVQAAAPGTATRAAVPVVKADRSAVVAKGDAGTNDRVPGGAGPSATVDGAPQAVAGRVSRDSDGGTVSGAASVGDAADEAGEDGLEVPGGSPGGLGTDVGADEVGTVRVVEEEEEREPKEEPAQIRDEGRETAGGEARCSGVGAEGVSAPGTPRLAVGLRSPRVAAVAWEETSRTSLSHGPRPGTPDSYVEPGSPSEASVAWEDAEGVPSHAHGDIDPGDEVAAGARLRASQGLPVVPLTEWDLGDKEGVCSWDDDDVDNDDAITVTLMRQATVATEAGRLDGALLPRAMPAQDPLAAACADLPHDVSLSSRPPADVPSNSLADAQAAPQLGTGAAAPRVGDAVNARPFSAGAAQGTPVSAPAHEPDAGRSSVADSTGPEASLGPVAEVATAPTPPPASRAPSRPPSGLGERTKSDLPTSLDGTPYLSLFPTFESLFCAYTRPPSSRPGTAGRGAPVDALRAALQGCLAWVGRELERAARRERSEGAGVQTLPLSWEPSPAELAVLQARSPSRVVVRCRTVEEHPEALEAAVLAMRLGRLTGRLVGWELDGEVSVRDEGTGRVGCAGVWMGRDLDADVEEAVREAASRARVAQAAEGRGARGVGRGGGQRAAEEGGNAGDGEDRGGEAWNVMLAWSARSTVDLGPLLTEQKANHFPNIRQLARKDLLARHLARWQRVAAGNPRLASVLACMPSTFVLPSDWPEFEYVFATAGGNDVPMPQGMPPPPPTVPAQPAPLNLWLAKPATQSRGRGIAFVHSADHAQRLCHPRATPASDREQYVVQRYVADPLLIDGRKFDLRVYVLVTSSEPLEAFVYQEGFARFCGTDYDVTGPDLAGHLTNVAFQRDAAKNGGKAETSLPLSITHGGRVAGGEPRPAGVEGGAGGGAGGDGAAGGKGAGWEWAFDAAGDEGWRELCEEWAGLDGGTKIPLSRLWALLEERGMPGRAAVWPQVCACVLAALFAVQGEVESPPSCFELLGFDVLLDARGRTWLLEANTSPSMEMHTPLDRAVKARLWHDVLAAVRPAPFDRLELIRVLQRRLGLAGRRAGRGRGLLLGTQAGDRQVCADDLAAIFQGRRPRSVGEDPSHLGLFERLAPSKLYGHLQRLRHPRLPSGR